MAFTESELNLVHTNAKNAPTSWHRRKRFIFLGVFVAVAVLIAIAIPSSRSSHSNSNAKSRGVVLGDANMGGTGLGGSQWASSYHNAQGGRDNNPDHITHAHTSVCDISAVVISEISAGEHGQWVELQNTGRDCVADLARYVLQLKGSNLHVRFTTGCKNNILGSGKYITVHSEEKPVCGLPWKLDSAAGELSLLRRGRVIDSVQWADLPHSKTLARDATGKYSLTRNATESLSNKFG